jgi:hypothetical protein
VVSNHIILVATFVLTKALLSPLLDKSEGKSVMNRNLFITTCLSPHLNLLSPHVTNGDKVGHHFSNTLISLFVVPPLYGSTNAMETSTEFEPLKPGILTSSCLTLCPKLFTIEVLVSMSHS